MNSKGQISVGLVLGIFISILVGLVLLQPAAQYVGAATQQGYVSANLAGGNMTTTTLIGKHAYNFVLYNTTSGAVIPATNYTVTNEVILSDGSIGSTVRTITGSTIAQPMTMNYTYDPVGYISEAGGRSIAALIVIFAALAIGLIALYPTIKAGIDNL